MGEVGLPGMVGAHGPPKRRRGPARIPASAVAIGIAVAAVSSAVLANAPPVVALASLGGVLLVAGAVAFGSLAADKAAVFWLAAYVLMLPLDVGKRVTHLAMSAQDVLSTIGLPPSGNIGLRLFPTDACLLALVACALLRSRGAERGLELEVPRETWLAAGFLGWAALSATFRAEWPGLSVVQISQEAKYLVVFLVAANLLAERRMATIARNVLFLAIVFQAVMTFAATAAGTPGEPILFRLLNLNLFTAGVEYPDHAGGTFGNPAGLGLFEALVAPVAIAGLLVERRPARQVALALLVAAAVGPLYLSKSRSAMIGFAFGLVAMVLAAWQRRTVDARRLRAALGLLALASLAASPLLYKYMTARPDPFYSRFELMREGLRIFSDNPILGVGLSNSTAVRNSYYGLRSLFPVHNQLVALLSEVGAVGTVLYVGFFAACLWRALRLAGDADPFVASLALAVIGGIVGLAGGLLGDHLYGNTQNSLLWLLAGLACALDRMVARGGPSPAVRAAGG